jgi:hypothetical protein
LIQNSVMKKQWNVEEYLKVTAQRAFQIDAMHTRLHKVFGKEAGEQDDDVDEDMLSPTERVKYYTLKDKMGKVKVAHIYARPETLDLHFFNLSLYCGLQELILEMVPPSTAIDLFSLRDRLVSLEIINSGIPDMAKALTTGLSRSFFKNFMPMVLQKATAPGGRRASASGPEYDQYKWSKLTLLRLRNCGLCRMDSSLHLFPAVTTVDLSHNQISNIIHLQDCHWLSDLDLSCNRISVLSNLSRVVGNLLHLNLSNNLISNLDGIEKLYALESVNLANNEIDDESEIRLLTRLPCLESIELKGNPISEESGYREFFFLQFLVDGQIQRSGREVPMLDNEPMDKSELRMLRSQLFRVPDEQQKDLSHVDHDFDGNIDRCSEADGDSSEAVDGGGGRGRSSTTPHRLSAFSDMSMRELSATLKGEDIAAAAYEYDSMATGSGSERRRFSLGAEKGAGSTTTMSGSDLSNPKVRNLGGANGGRNALVSATSFSSGERGTDNGNGHWSGGSPLRGSPTRRAKTQYESIATNGGGVGEVYVRKAKAGKRLAANNRVVVEIAGDQNQSVDGVDVTRMLEDAAERIMQASAGNGRHFMADIHSSPIKILRAADAGQLLPLVPATVPGTATSTAAAPNANENVNASSPSALRSPSATMSRVESLRSTDSPQSDVHSLATTPQIYSLHETTQEREGIHRESIERLMNFATASDSDDRNLSTASMDSDTEDFNIGSLGAPSAMRDKVEPAPDVTIQESIIPIRSEANNFEMNRSRLVSRDMPLDQRMRLLSGALSSEEGGGGSSRQVSVDSMGSSSLNQLRASLAGGTQQDVSVLRGAEAPKEGSSLTGPTAFLASVAERAKEEKVKEKDEKKDKTTPISSLFGTLGMASSSTPASSGASTPAVSPVRGGNTEQRLSFGGGSGGSSPSTRSSKAIAAAASLTAKWAAKAAAASAPSPSPPRGEPSEEAAAASSNEWGRNSSPSRNSETGKVGGPSLAGLPVVDALDDFASKYVGELEYRRLRVAENLELYLKEQVFRNNHGGSSSGSGHLYLAWKNTPTVSVGEGKEQYVKRSAETEVYLSCFLEVVNALGAPPQDSPKGTAVTSSSERKKMKKEKKKKKEKEGGKIDDDAVEETNNIIILTSEAVYFVAATIAPSLTFDDAPLLQVLSAHSLYSLRSCTVYFGFQRCMLEFVSCISPGEEGEVPYDFGNEPVFRYMVVTREKSNTHPIITKIPKAANSARTDRTNTVSAMISDNVKIFNRDSQLLDAVADYAESKSHGKSKKHDPDIAHYQMLHQIWRKRPGVSAPRSIVITSTFLLLCIEDLHRQDVKLSVLDYSSVGDISKVIAEDDPFCVTVVFKSASFGITQRKWRVRLSSTAAASKLLQDLRKD